MIDGVYYNVLSPTNMTVSVTYKGEYATSYDEYSGDVIIPNIITYNGISYSVIAIGNSAFSGYANLTSVIISDSVASISHKAFSGCSSLASITIGDSVNSIGDYAFYYCNGLTSVIIGRSLSTIGDSAFYGCNGLTEIYSLSTTPPEIKASTFFNVNKQKCNLYVPIGCKDMYTENSLWGEFHKIVEVNINPTDFEYNALRYGVIKSGEDGASINKSVSVIANPNMTIEYISNKKVASISSGNRYIIVAKGFAATSSYHSYGYLSSTAIIEKDNNSIDISDETSTVFTFIATDNGYNIFDFNGRYVYQSGNYNSFDFDVESPAKGAEWSAECQEDGAMKITNTAVGKFIQYDSLYNFFGSYADNRGVIPSLYEYYGADSIIIYKEIIIPETVSFLTTNYKVIAISDSAFSDHVDVISVTLPAGIERIGEGAFRGCSEIKEINTMRIHPADASATAFDGVDKNICILNVPVGCRESYANAPVWKEFNNIVEKTEIGITEDIFADDNETCNVEVIDGELCIYSQDETLVVVYSMSGTVLYNDYIKGYLQLNYPHGFYIIRAGSTIKKIAI